MALPRPLLLVGLVGWGQGTGYAPIEPYLGSWCAELFPSHIVDYNGYSMLRMTKNHVKIEPYLGEWCFAQFPTELLNVNANQSIADLYENHISIEPFLKDWSDQSTLHWMTQPHDVEPYVGQWCTQQYPHELGHLASTVVATVTNFHVDLEPILINWCLEQFAPEFDEPVTADVIEQLDLAYWRVEHELIGWGLTFRPGQSSHSSPLDKQEAAIFLLSIALAISLAALIYLCLVRPSPSGHGRRPWCSLPWCLLRVSNKNNNTHKEITEECQEDHVALNTNDPDLTFQDVPLT